MLSSIFPLSTEFPNLPTDGMSPEERAELSRLLLRNAASLRASQAAASTRWWGHRWLEPLEVVALVDSIWRKTRARRRSFFKRTMHVGNHPDGIIADAMRLIAAPDSWSRSREESGLRRLATSYLNLATQADLRGITYAAWIVSAWALAEKTRHGGLEPNQAYAPRYVAAACAAWDEFGRHHLLMTDHPYFSRDSYVGNPDQQAYQQALIERVKRNPRRLDVLEFMGNRVVRELFVSRFPAAAADFDEKVAECARREMIARSTVSATSPSNLEDVLKTLLV